MSKPNANTAGSSASSGDSSAPMRAWTLTPEAFSKLLSFLDEDPSRAAAAYEDTRRRLLRLFEWRGCNFPDELVDETINRVARKVAEGERIHTEEPYRYFCGVARLVFHEVIRKEQRQRAALEKERWSLKMQAGADEDTESERRLDCLQRGLDSLPENSRGLILRYYEGEKSTKIANRRELALEYGIQLNALRIRAHRIRQKLEASVSECLESTQH